MRLEQEPQEAGQLGAIAGIQGGEVVVGTLAAQAVHGLVQLQARRGGAQQDRALVAGIGFAGDPAGGLELRDDLGGGAGCDPQGGGNVALAGRHSVAVRGHGVEGAPLVGRDAQGCQVLRPGAAEAV